MVDRALCFALQQEHIMYADRQRLTTSMFALLSRGLELAREYDASHPDFPLPSDAAARFFSKWLLFSLLWAFGGSMDLKGRLRLGQHLKVCSCLGGFNSLSMKLVPCVPYCFDIGMLASGDVKLL